MIATACVLTWALPNWGLAWLDRDPPDPDPARFAEAIEGFAEADRDAIPDPEGILFVGSSSILRWDLEASFPGLGALNRGFGGSQLSDVIHFSDRVIAPYRPHRIVLYAGDNDIAVGKVAERVRDDFRRLVRRIRRKAPDATVYYLSIKPSPSRRHVWPEAQRANALISKECEQNERLVFVDISSPMLGPDETFRPELYAKDQLHLSDQGYEVWADVLRPLLLGASE